MVVLLFNIVAVIIEAFLINASSLTIRQKRKLYIGVAFCQLFVIHALLDPETMPDLPGYCEMYQTFGENSLQESILVGYVGVKMEPGWIVLCKVLYNISRNPRLLLILSSLIMVGGYLKTISKYSYLPWLSVIIYLCTTFDQSLFVLRQHCAIALSLLSVPLIINRELKRYLILMIVCVFIHSSSIIFFPMYFLYNLNLNKYWIFVTAITIAGVLLSNTVFPWLFSHTWYGGYADREGSNYTLFFISLSALILYLYSIKFKVTGLKGADKYFMLLITMSVLLCLCGAGFSPTNRLVKYFSVASIFVIPRAISHFNGTTSKTLIIVIVIFFHLLLFFAPSNTDYIQDYRFVLFD